MMTRQQRLPFALCSLLSSAFCFLLCAFCLLPTAFGQSATATLSGTVEDQNGAAIPGVTVTAVNKGTQLTREAITKGDGSFTIPLLPPGGYTVRAQGQGFAPAEFANVVLNVGDQKALQIQLKAGDINATVQVVNEASLVDESPAVGTVVDRRFVENMPLNGRSFQTLIALTPGVVLTQTNANAPGQFSVNGQRTDANYFTVDGVSANFGSSAGSGAALYQTAGGAIPALSASGGTNSLVSVDAMQEFRIQTSSFAPEFGSTPGGQVAIVTRSGTNQFHGTLFDYFRNDVLDARDWFVNQNGLQKPKERQNDFGGVLGGHIIKNKTFFFFSYEGLRLRQPRVAVTLVPDNQSRQTAPAPTMPFLNAFPVANGQALGNGVAKFTASYSDPSSLDAYSIRIDHAIHSKLSLFGRYNNAPSDTVQRQTSQALSDLQTTQITTRTFTLALVANIAKDKINELRVNYSTSRAAGFYSLDQFGGAVPLSDGALFPTGFSSSNGRYQFFVNGVGGLLIGKDVTNEQRQVNVLDNLQITRDAHLLKFGFDYRWLAPLAGPSAYQQLAFFFGMTGSSGALSGVLPFDGITALQGSALLSQNFSLYGQDTWKATQRLTLTYGLRWNVNPALRGKNSNSELFTVSGLDNPATMTLAPRGTPLYATTYGNVAPRVGVAYKLTQSQNWGSVLRGAFGVFYDLGTGSLGAATSGFPHSANKFLFGVPFPVTGPQAAPPIISSNPPVSLIYVSDPHLKLPRTYEWNVAVEQSLGADQTVSATYVGALGRDLLRQDTLSSPNPTFTGSVSVTRNTSASYFHALQVKFQRRLSLGLQVLASYSFSHSIDSGSEDFFLYNTPGAVTNSYVDRGNSDFDVRHAFTAAVSYDVPAPGRSAVAHLLLGGWSLDAFVMARSALPVGISTAISVVNGSVYSARPNVVPGVPLYLYGSQYPGGKRFNSAAFIAPTPGQRGNFGRNVLRGFGAWQTDLALRRRFHLTERFGLQFSAEFFNLFNHPNFGDPLKVSVFTQIANPLFGLSTQTLANSLGTGGAAGGFNPLYQIGGPRSIQLALKLTF